MTRIPTAAFNPETGGGTPKRRIQNYHDGSRQQARRLAMNADRRYDIRGRHVYASQITRIQMEKCRPYPVIGGGRTRQHDEHRLVPGVQQPQNRELGIGSGPEAG